MPILSVATRIWLSRLRFRSFLEQPATQLVAEPLYLCILIYVSYQLLMGTLFHPAAADARSVRWLEMQA
jgi:hypothetical protein